MRLCLLVAAISLALGDFVSGMTAAVGRKGAAHFHALLELTAGTPADELFRFTGLNLPEGINNQIENLRRNAGGHFHSQREALIKMKLLANHLYDFRWRRVNPKLLGQIGTLNELFRKRFEVDLNPETFLTQNF